MASWWWCSSPFTTVSVITSTKTHRYSPSSHTSQFQLNSFPPPTSLRFSTTPSSLRFRVPCSNKTAANKGNSVPGGSEVEFLNSPPPPSAVDCVGTGQNVECLLEEENANAKKENESPARTLCLAEGLWEGAVLVSPFFFWGTAMVAMKEVLPKYGPFFVASFRLIPAGFLLVGFAASRGRPFPSGFKAWLSIALFAVIDAACFQVSFLTQCAFVYFTGYRYALMIP